MHIHNNIFMHTVFNFFNSIQPVNNKTEYSYHSFITSPLMPHLFLSHPIPRYLPTVHHLFLSPFLSPLLPLSLLFPYIFLSPLISPLLPLSLPYLFLPHSPPFSLISLHLPPSSHSLSSLSHPSLSPFSLHSCLSLSLTSFSPILPSLSPPPPFLAFSLLPSLSIALTLISPLLPLSLPYLFLPHSPFSLSTSPLPRILSPPFPTHRSQPSLAPPPSFLAFSLLPSPPIPLTLISLHLPPSSHSLSSLPHPSLSPLSRSTSLLPRILSPPFPTHRSHPSLSPPPIEKDYKNSRYHFAHSDDYLNFANLLIEMQMNTGLSCEVDIFIVQATLQFVALNTALSLTLIIP